MPENELGYKVNGDTSPIKRAIAALLPYFQEAGKKFGDRFKLGWAAGMAAVAGAAVLAIGAAFRAASVEASANLRESFKQDIGIDDYTALKHIADDIGESVEKLVRTLKEGGDNAARLREQMEEVKRLFAPQSKEATSGLVQLNYLLDQAWNTTKNFTGAATAMGTKYMGRVFAAGQGVREFLKRAPIMFTRLGFARHTEDELSPTEAFKKTYAMRVKQFDEAPAKLIARLKAERDAADAAALEQEKNDEVLKKMHARREAELDKIKSDEEKAAKLVPIKPPEADALTKVGIFTGRTAYERNQYEQQSLKYLESIARNTGKSGAGGVPQVPI